MEAGRVLTILGQCPSEEGSGHAWLAAAQSSRITTEQGLGLAQVGLVHSPLTILLSKTPLTKINKEFLSLGQSSL